MKVDGEKLLRKRKKREKARKLITVSDVAQWHGNFKMIDVFIRIAVPFRVTDAKGTIVFQHSEQGKASKGAL